MQLIKNNHFYPSYQQDNEVLSAAKALLILLCVAVVFITLGIITIDLDPAFGIATKSRALYVDEGFYSDAAQNFVKFGQWGLPFDSRHWPGAPIITILQTLVFSVFGVSLTAARVISLGFGIISLISLYSLARMKLTPVIALLLSIATVLTISFTTHSRAAIADPVATGFSLLAILVYVRLCNKFWAIPLSLILAYLAFCSKMYFLFALGSISTLWSIELIILPILEKRKIQRRKLFVFITSLVLITGSYIALRIRFDDSFSQFLQINSNKVPSLDIIVLFKQLINSLQNLPFNSKTHVFIVCIAATLMYFIITRMHPDKFAHIKNDFYTWDRVGWALSLFLVLGLCTIAALNLPNKAHYHYHTILPIGCLAVFAVNAILPRPINSFAIMVILALHVVFQAMYYDQWVSRPKNTKIHNANIELIKLIEQRETEGVIPVIGQYSAQLALYSDRIMSLEVKWLPKDALCQQLEFWRPLFFVNFVFPQRVISEGDRLAKCEQLGGFEEIVKFQVNQNWRDELVLYRITYKN